MRSGAAAQGPSGELSYPPLSTPPPPPSVLHCRDRFLKPGGLMLPSRARLLVAGVSDGEMFAKRVAFWDDVYGVSMVAMKKHLFREPYVEVVPAASIATAAAALREFHLLSMADAEQDFVDAPFTLLPAGDAAAPPPPLHGLCLWFDTDFTAERFAGAAAGAAAAVPSPSPLPACATLPTGPLQTPTHWAQTLLLFEAPLTLPPGGAAGTLTMLRDASNPREYRIALTLHAAGTAAAAAAPMLQQSYHMR